MKNLPSGRKKTQHLGGTKNKLRADRRRGSVSVGRSSIINLGAPRIWGVVIAPPAITGTETHTHTHTHTRRFPPPRTVEERREAKRDSGFAAYSSRATAKDRGKRRQAARAAPEARNLAVNPPTNQSREES